jgi:hypothetical protein
MREEIPPSLRMKPLASSFTDQPYMILHRLNLDLLYQKSLCVLHQNYLNHDRLDPKFAYSKKICTDSALQILKYQAELHVACQPGGQLGTEKLVPSSVVLHDYLLAAMAISLDLHKPYNKLGSITPEELKTRDEKYNALRSSYCGRVKWSAPEKSPDLAYAEYPYGLGRVWAIVIPVPGISCILG